MALRWPFFSAIGVQFANSFSQQEACASCMRIYQTLQSNRNLELNEKVDTTHILTQPTSFCFYGRKYINCSNTMKEQIKKIKNQTRLLFRPKKPNPSGDPVLLINKSFSSTTYFDDGLYMHHPKYVCFYKNFEAKT